MLLNNWTARLGGINLAETRRRETERAVGCTRHRGSRVLLQETEHEVVRIYLPRFCPLFSLPGRSSRGLAAAW